MAFSDRTYARGNSGYFPNGVKWLLIANVVVYLLQFFIDHSDLRGLFAPFYLFPTYVVGRGWLWQLVTYMFLHDPDGFGHILFNMLSLWMFGVSLENEWGTRRFLKYYLLCGIGAGVCVVIANLLFGNGAPTIGASGAIYGLLLAFGYLWPNRTVYFSFLFPIQAKYFVMIMGALAFLSSYAAPGGPVSHIAHLGGMIVGFVLLRTEPRSRVAAGYAGYGGAHAQAPRKRRTSFTAEARAWYKEWKLQRARRKFEVYLKKHQRDRDPFVH